MTINVYDNLQWKIPKAIYVYNANANAWSETTSVSIWASGAWQKIHNTYLFTSNTVNANIYTTMGSPTIPVNAKITIDANVWMTASNSNVAAINVGPFPLGSRVYIVNNGVIQGTQGNAGWPGGNAISTTTSLLINNNGTISGGQANTIVSAGVGYYLSGSTLTTFENSGLLIGLVK